MFRPTLRRALQQSPTQIYTSPYRAKRSWPPDFSKLTKKEQFRLERRYKRRVKLKWARPRWTKAVKLTQFGSIVFVLVYGVLFLDWKQENQPFQGFRNWFFGLTGSLFGIGNQAQRVQRRDVSNDASATAK